MGVSKVAEVSSSSWTRRPLAALLVRAITVLAPLLAGWLSVRYGQAYFIAQDGPRAVVFWVIQAILVAVVATLVVSRLTSRLIPLVGLLNMTLVFPDRAPSRFGVALRSGMGHKLTDETIELSPDAQAAAVEALALVGSLGEHERLTRGHTERVRAYADLIGQEMGLPAEDLNKLRWGVLLHDIGKLHVEPEVLNKSGRPTAAEWKALSEHPESGMEILEPLKDWLGPWMNAAGEHHERWDGAGYPLGLKGTEISLAGRITAVADSFDVITSTRSYKSALSSDTAREELVRHAGTQFDPAIVRAFLRVGLAKRRSLGFFGWLLELPGVGQVVQTVAAAPAAVTVSVAVMSVSVASLGAPVLDQPSSLAFGSQVSRAVVSTTTSSTMATTTSGLPVIITAAPMTTTSVSPTTSTSEPTVAPTTTLAPTTTTAAAPTTVAPTTTAAPTTTFAPTTTTVAPTTVAPTPTTTIAPPGPNAVNDSYVTSNDDWKTMSVLSNDTSPLPLFDIEITGQPAHADEIEIRSNWRIRYYIDDDFEGTDQFTYRICDVGGNCDSATVTLTVVDD